MEGTGFGLSGRSRDPFEAMDGGFEWSMWDLGYPMKDGGELSMARMKKNPSKRGVSAASVKGNAGPQVEQDGGGKVNSQNNQFKK